MDRLIQVGVLSLGGALGANARYWLGAGVALWLGPSWWPWSTFLINVSGSFAIGLLAVLLARWLPQDEVRLLLITGFLGGYTTYSTFAYESLALWERGGRGAALAYMGGTLVAGFVAVALGAALARGLSGPDERAVPGPPAARETERGGP